jgi:uncharacterized membrane protein YesL
MKKKKFKRYDHSDGFFQSAKRPKGPVRKFLEIWLENVWTLIPLNVMYATMRILLIPGGLAQAGMTKVTLDLSRERHSFIAADFFETIRKSWRKALPAGLLILVLWIFLLLVGWFYFTSSGLLATMGLGCCMAAMFFLSLAEHYVFLQIVLLKLPLKKAFKNACILVFVDWKKNLLLGLVRLGYFAVALAIFMLLPYTVTPALLLVITVCFFPGLMQLLTQHCIFPGVKTYLIDPYYAAHPEEDLEKRKDMGIL